MIDPSRICAVLAAARVDLSTERAAQADIETLLVQAFGRGAVQREARLSAADRPDFLLGGVALEVKIKTAAQRQSSVWKQLRRYAAHDVVHALILVTNKTMPLPQAILGKPAFFVSLGRAWL